MTLDSCLYVRRKGGAWGTEFHHLCRGTLDHMFCAFLFHCGSVSFQITWSRTNTFSVHFPTCSHQDSLCLLFVFVLIGMSEASKAIFAFKAVAVYSPPPVFNAVNTQSGHVGFVCVCYTVCKCSSRSITCIEVQQYSSSRSCLGLECHFIEFLTYSRPLAF